MQVGFKPGIPELQGGCHSSMFLLVGEFKHAWDKHKSILEQKGLEKKHNKKMQKNNGQT